MSARNTRTAPATSAPVAEARTSVYRTREDFLAALGAAKGLTSGNPAFGSAVRVLVHLSWKGPKGSVGWHKGTNADVVANAAAHGATPGTPLPTAIGGVLDALEAAADTDARKVAVKALRASVI
jgi:hypothetical protein